MGINLGSTRPWLDIAICLRITPQKACIMWHYSFYLAQRRLNVLMFLFSRVLLLWQLLTIRGGVQGFCCGEMSLFSPAGLVSEGSAFSFEIPASIHTSQ
jgi:hypothetical protein